MACSRVRPLAAVVVNRSASKIADTDGTPVTGTAGEGPSPPAAPHSSLINPRLSMAGGGVRRFPKDEWGAFAWFLSGMLVKMHRGAEPPCICIDQGSDD